MKQKLVYLLKHNPFIQRVYKHTMSFIFRLIGLFVPVNPDLVLFVSFMGTKYNDSPRAISEYLAQAVREDKTVLLEGQLGTLKDPDHGIYPMVTSSSTLAAFGAIGAFDDLGLQCPG